MRRVPSLRTFQLALDSDALADALTRAVVHVDTDSVPPVDCEVALEITLTGRPPLLVTGRVGEIEIDQTKGTSRPVGMDVHLVNLPADVKLQLARLLADLRDPLESAPPDVGARLDQVETETRRLQVDLESLADEDLDSRVLVERLSEELDQLQDRIDDANPELRELRERRAQLERELRSLAEGSRRAALEAEIAAARQSAEDAERTTAEAQATQERERVDIEEAITAAARELEELRATGQRELETATHDLDRARARVAKLETQLTQIDTDIPGTESSTVEAPSDLTQRVENATAELAEAQREGQRLQAEIDAQLEAHERLRSKRRDQTRLSGMMAARGRLDSGKLQLDDSDLDHIDALFADLGAHESGDHPPAPEPVESVWDDTTDDAPSEPGAAKSVWNERTDPDDVDFAHERTPPPQEPEPSLSIGLAVGVVGAFLLLALAITELISGGALIVRPLLGGGEVGRVEVVEVPVAGPSEPAAPEPVEEAGPDLDALVAEARASYSRGRVRAAIDLLKTSLEHDPDHVDSLILLGQFQLEQKGPAAAVAPLKRALLLNPRGAYTVKLLADTHRALGKPDTARPLYQRYLRMAPRGRFVEEVEASLAGLDEAAPAEP